VVRKAIDYGLSIVGAPYVWWTDGPVPDRSPAWAENAPPPPPEEVINEGCFCAGVPNLMLRVVGGELPTLGNELYDGGCLAYGEYYYNVAEPFDINEDYPPGTLIGRYFTWERSANGDQGHVAVVLEDGYLLQSYDGDGYGYPGVNAATHIVDSHAGYYYEYAVRPENWIGLDEDEGEDWDGYEDSGSTVPGDGSLLTADYLVAIMPNNLPYERAEYLLPYLTAALEEFEINTGSRVAMFLANVAVETGEFQWFQELDSWDGTYLVNKPYYPYYGRGVIHLTWQENYAAAGDYFGEDLVSYPDRAADVDLAFRIAGWFWRYWSAQGDLNVAADNGDFDTTCLGVNGGWNGYQERCAYYDAACQVLGV
jgi:predicted chitinase